MEVENLVSRAHINSVAKGFWKTREEVPDIFALTMSLALIHSEVSEALEAVRNSDVDNFDEELADIVIRVADLAGWTGTNLTKAIEKKMAKNEERPTMHGKEF